MMDEIARYNRERWRALAAADALFTRPQLELDENSAKDLVDPANLFGSLAGKRVLCLAGGGGQQSAAFAILGAEVSVLDISKEQLERDKRAAEHYGIGVETFEGDMRDLSEFSDDFFGIVFQPYSINFVVEISKVFREVARVLKPNGLYQLSFANPFVMDIKQTDWNGEGYLLRRPYAKNAGISYPDQDWVYEKGKSEAIPPPREYRHNLSDILNELIGSGFVVRHLADDRDMFPDAQAEPGSWDHLVAFAPPWLSVLAVYRPDLKF